MCGRYTRRYTRKEVQRFLAFRFPGQVEAPPLEPSYNVAPTQLSPIARRSPETGGVEIAMARWGLIPSWADDPKIGNRLINARADGVADKPAFRSAFRTRRCLVPISGFYEWQAVKGSKAKQPWYIHRADDEITCVAGLWERWDKGDEPVDSFAIVTTDANELVRPIHDRMPVVLEPEDFDTWLDPNTPPEALRALLRPAADGVLTAHRVSTRVNTPKENDPALIEPRTE